MCERGTHRIKKFRIFFKKKARNYDFFRVKNKFEKFQKPDLNSLRNF